VHTVIPEGDWSVRGNDSLLHSAVENVVRNAIRYTQEGSSVEIELNSEKRGDRAEAVLRVSDSGSGVPADACRNCSSPSTGWMTPVAGSQVEWALDWQLPNARCDFTEEKSRLSIALRAA